jgi:small subunit ribosomal protein S15
MQTSERKTEIMGAHAIHPTDTGSPEVQIALITDRIAVMNAHFDKFPQDHASRRGLMALVNRRRRLLDYLKEKSVDKYQALISKLGIRR